MDLVHLPERTFDRKRIFAYSNLNTNRISNFKPNPNSKAQKPFRKNEMTSFFVQVSRYLVLQISFFKR